MTKLNSDENFKILPHEPFIPEKFNIVSDGPLTISIDKEYLKKLFKELLEEEKNER